MTNSKWLRRALLSGVALGVATTGAQADDLNALKAQLEALQSRVNQLESTPAPAALPDGASLITFKRGQGSLSDWNVDRAAEGSMPQDRGFTIAITPTADVPAPVTEVTVSGYVKGDVIYDFDQDTIGDAFSAASITNANQSSSGVRLHARQSRFRIRSRTDTAIGQIRTLIEVDFFRFTTGGRAALGSGPGGLVANNAATNNDPGPRLRHAWGEWDMTPNWTLGVGRFWRISCDVFTSVGLVDFGGSAGACSDTRAAQVRFTYTSGPLSLRFGIQEPHLPQDRLVGFTAAAPAGQVRVSPDFPNFAAALLYDAPGGHQLFAGVSVEHIDVDSSEATNLMNDDDVGWEVQAGANINLADVATFTGHIQYGDGIANAVADGNANFRLNNGAVQTAASQIVTNEVLGAYAGLSFNVTDTTQFNVQYGTAAPGCLTCATYTSAHTLHANVMWRPVRQMRLGWEVIYGWKRNTTATATTAGRRRNEDALRAQFGAWFFF